MVVDGSKQRATEELNERRSWEAPGERVRKLGKSRGLYSDDDDLEGVYSKASRQADAAVKTRRWRSLLR